MKFLRFLPFSSPWIIRHHLGKHKSVLDVGCGDGSLMLKVNPDKKYKVVGVDFYNPSLKKANHRGIYKKVILKDIRKINFKDKSFDIVLASQVIEHLSKKDALNLIKKMEKIAKFKVILTTPRGFIEFDPFEVNDKNKLQDHKSGWEIDELKKFGYKVFGQGAGFIYSPTGLLYKYKKFKDIFTLSSFLLSPFTYFIPSTSTYLVAIKHIE